MTISPLCLAVNIGSVVMVETILSECTYLDVDAGVRIQARAKEKRGRRVKQGHVSSDVDLSTFSNASLEWKSAKTVPVTRRQSAVPVQELTPLYFAVSLGLYKIVSLLVAKGAKVNLSPGGIPIIFSAVDRALMFRNFKFPMFSYAHKFDH